jgi:RNase P/RNase MRP subunit p29
VFINVTLFDGNSISGRLISETADALVIQPKNFKAITVRKTEIKESARN